MRPKTGDRKCYKCKEIKPLSAFYSFTQSYCKPCARAWRKRRYNLPDMKKKVQKYIRERCRSAREKVLKAYSVTPGHPSCICCGEDEVKFLSIDHINNDGASQRRSQKIPSGSGFYIWLINNNFPKEFQILCHNCNHGKYLNGGTCPHITKGIKHFTNE